MEQTEEQEQKRLRRQQHNKRGALLLAIGAFTLLLSFGLTYLSHSADQHPGFGLYGLTSIGAILLFAGLVYLFE